RRGCRWTPSVLSLEHDVDLLFALSRDHRFIADVFAALLALAADVGHESANHFAHYTSGRGNARLGVRRRKISALVIVGRRRGSRRRLDDFSSNQRSRRRPRCSRASRPGIIKMNANGRRARGFNYGPWLVGLGAALWGTESAWRIPLNDLFDAEVIVFWEHVLILLMFLPILLPSLGQLRKIDISTWSYLLFFGFAGSVVGTIFFTLALKYGNPTVVNVILNIQPLISTFGAFVFFRDRLAPRFFLYVAIAILAGVCLSIARPDLISVSLQLAGLSLGTCHALLCAFFCTRSAAAARAVRV